MPRGISSRDILPRTSFLEATHIDQRVNYRFLILYNTSKYNVLEYLSLGKYASRNIL